MKRPLITALLAASVLAAHPTAALAQHPDVTLHVNPKWESCAIQLDPSLTQDAWRQFTEEAGVLTYFRPLADARPMGARKFEVSILQWQTAIDETTDAWNNTFVHPDDSHWLTEGGSLAIPGLIVRAGVSDKIDLGAYFTKNMQSNYGLWGGQLQYSVFHHPEKRFAAAARLSFVSLYGPDDVDLTVYGMDLLASKTYAVSKPLSVSPYAGLSTMYSRAHEKTGAVNLEDESAWGVMGMLGAAAQLSFARLAVEYNVANVNSLSFKLGFGF